MTITVKPSKGDETWRGKWPERIPRCPTESPNTEHLPAPWSDRNSDDEEDNYEEARMRTIVYRTTGGKKHRLNHDTLAIIGSMIDMSSSEDDDEMKQTMYGRLKYAQAFVRSKFEKKH
jgi:hypothetical protein